MGSRKNILVIIVFLLMFCVSKLQKNLEVEVENEVNSDPPPLLITNYNYTLHNPIEIRSNDVFHSQGWPGDGTDMNPYIISNLSISSEQECIFILGTTVHFDIRDCWLSDGSCGIRFENVQNGIIEKCQISGVDTGIVFSNSQNCSIGKCNITAGPFRPGGFLFNGSESCTIAECETTGDFLNCRLCIVRECTLDRFWLEESELCTVIDCIIDYQVFIVGDYLSYWIHAFENVTVNQKPLGYFIGLNWVQISSNDFSQLFIVDCQNIDVIGEENDFDYSKLQIVFSENCSVTGPLTQVIIRASIGIILRNMTKLRYLRIQDCEQIYLLNSTTGTIHLRDCSHCFISGNDINAGWESNALVMVRCKECVVSHNTINYGFACMTVSDSAECVVSYNIFKSGYDGIEISNSIECNFTGNQITDCDDSGFGLDSGSSYNIITYNYITENGVGVSIEGDFNVIYGNFLAYNNDPSIDNGNGNQWDDGFSIGNYWGNITTTEPIALNGVDRFPIMIKASNLSKPVVSSPNNFTIGQNEGDWNITWIVWGNPCSYELYRNGERIITGSTLGCEPIEVSLYGLGLGLSNFTLLVYDNNGNQVVDTVFVDVQISSVTIRIIYLIAIGGIIAVLFYLELRSKIRAKKISLDGDEALQMS